MKHYPFNGTPEQRANLLKLAEYLEKLPNDYSRFDMAQFATLGEKSLSSLDIEQLKIDNNGPGYQCGAVCCMVGHGPAAGIDPKGINSWWQYARIKFAAESDDEAELDDGGVWDWLFDCDWKRVDNTPRGGAARIRYMLQHGIPENYISQISGKAPLCYTVT